MEVIKNKGLNMENKGEWLLHNNKYIMTTFTSGAMWCSKCNNSKVVPTSQS